MVISSTFTGQGPYKPVVQIDADVYLLDMEFKSKEAAEAKASIIVSRIYNDVRELLSEEDFEAVAFIP